MTQSISVLNTVLGTTLNLDTSTTPYYILDSVDWGAIVASHHEYKYIDQYGVTIVGTSIGTREIEIKGWIIASTDDEMTQRKQAINKFFNPLHYMELYYSSYKIGFYCQNSVKYGNEMRENNEKIVHFVIDGLAPDPYFHRVTNNYYDASSVKGMFHFPLILKDNHTDSLVFSELKQTTMFEVYNWGHVPCGCKITFYARGGTVENPKIIDIDTQDFIQIDKTLERGEKIVINTNKGMRTITGTIRGVSSNYQRYKNIYSRWITLPIGLTNMNYSAEVGMDLLDVSVELNQQYQEVQECW